MEIFVPRFSLVATLIFEKLDSESLRNCREVHKSWQKLIDDRNLLWICNVNIPKVLQYDFKYIHLVARIGQIKMFKRIFREESTKNPNNEIDGKTPFLLACEYGHIEIAKMMIEKSAEFQIDLNEKGNAKDANGDTAFMLACANGHFKVIYS